MRIHHAIALVISSAGCPAGPEPAPTPTPAATPAEPPTPARKDAPSASTDAPSLGRVRSDGPLPILAILGHPPAQAEAQLGEPLGKGMTKKTCIRFVPERVFFECAYAVQRYGDRNATFGAIEVRYEDGRAASIAIEQFPEQRGAFDPRTALAFVGLELPGEPTIDQPAPDVTRWSWFNSAARLVIADRQYRVEVSTVGNTWNSAKVDLILNDPLTTEQRQTLITD